ncbi:hypothetical protein FOA52_005209 [Chlamydomonas sp. UWO 241]|nr:hypothetical protein FOA52_005209 [Chlamydomonas sp. UWO 241]
MDGVTEDVLTLGGDQVLNNKIRALVLSTQKGYVGTDGGAYSGGGSSSNGGDATLPATLTDSSGDGRGDAHRALAPAPALAVRLCFPGDPTVVAAVVTCLSHNGPSWEDAMAVALHLMRLKKGMRKNLHEGDVYKALRSMVRIKVYAMVVCDGTGGPGDPFVFRLTAIGEAAAAALDSAGDAMIGHDWTGGTGDPYVWSVLGPAAAAL